MCLSVYMIPCGLLLASAAAKVLGLWFQCGTKSEVVGAKMFFSDIGESHLSNNCSQNRLPNWHLLYDYKSTFARLPYGRLSI